MLAPEGDPKGPIEFDRCRVIEKLRSGPLTDLYHAEQLPLGRKVLIKALNPSVLPSSPFAAALEREARLLGEMQHDNIVRLYDFCRRADSMWLVLEYAGGTTLSALLRERKALPPIAAAAIGLQLARALGHAHGHGVVHRDVRPEHVLLHPDGRVKLMNFSVAADERLPTAPELLEGTDGFSTPSYMSPEQVLGEAPDARSDFFSLGVVLYEMVSGTRPFDAPDSRAATQRIRHDAPRPMARHLADIPSGLERAVQRCLQKLPADRFHTADELERALESIVAEAGSTAEVLVANLLSGATESSHRPRTAGRRRSQPKKPRELSLGMAVRGYLICLGLILIGAFAIQYAAARTRGMDARLRDTTLQLLPSKASYLRVTADPWAHVIVDGQRVDTTPFAYPIPLEAGVHYVRFEHPNAPTERRTIRLAPGETILLDVKMENPRPVLPPATPIPSQIGDPSTP